MPKLVLRGRVVTMDDAYTVHAQGAVYVDGSMIARVQAADLPAPDAFAGIAAVDVGGTIYPGLIELHNHLAYNALPLWAVPKRYTNRDQWGRIDDYRVLVSGPMQVLGHSDAMPALIRYVEAKCLLAGVTTSQGIELYSNHGARRYYRGIVRNVEQTDDAALPEALTKISDVEATQAAAFLSRLHGAHQLILHLAEGSDEAARAHFLALRMSEATWAITARLVAIHCVALRASDLEVLQAHGGSMVWSPLSNLLLYGATARIGDAVAAHVPVALGSDWSPSGSKNLLGELKAARYAAPSELSDREIVAMATCGAARILRWEQSLGSLAAAHRADLIVVRGGEPDPYRALIAANEKDLSLVMIDGVARAGVPSLMRRLTGGGERVTVGGAARVVNFADPAADPLVAKLTLGAARVTLRAALRRLPELAKEQEDAATRPRALAADAAAPPRWFLALDEIQSTGLELRPRLGDAGRAGGPRVVSPLAASPPLSKVLRPIDLDPLTACDDDRFLQTLKSERNLPPGLGAQIASAY